ncbi:MAG: alpha-E domain-containing protein, partial [Acidimicrobiales bacterium]
EMRMLLARMAEAVYWAGRYLERAECTARIIQVHVDTHIDLPVGEDVGWEPLLAIAGVDGAAFLDEAGTRAKPVAPTEADVIEYLLVDQAGHASIHAALTAARENLRSARAVVPREAWEACNDLWLACGDERDQVRFRDGRVQWLRRVVAGCQRISGVLTGTMSRDEALSFLLIGQNLERADLTSRVLDVRADNLQPRRGDDPYEAVRWMAVLRSLAAYQPFRRAMPARPQAGSTLRFLLQDDRFPRAVAACLSEARSHLKGLARTEGALEACTNASMVVAAAPVPRLTVSGLSMFVDELQVALTEVHDQIDRTYFHPKLTRWQPEHAVS